MIRSARIPLSLGSFLALSLLAVPGVAAQEDAAAGIAASNAALSAAVAAGDANAVVALYTSDAMLMAPNAPSATGHEAIRAAFEGMVEAGIASLSLTTDEIQAHGDVAHEVGRYVLEGKDGSHLDHGKYIVIWQRAADGWKLHRDIFNSDMAAPTH